MPSRVGWRTVATFTIAFPASPLTPSPGLPTCVLSSPGFDLSPEASPACLAVPGTQRGFLPSHSLDCPASIFLRPFAPPALPGFLATMSALTPATVTPVTGLPGSSAQPSLPFRLQPPGRPQRRFRTLPISSLGSLPSTPLRHRLYPPAPAQAWPRDLRSLHEASGRSGLRHSLAGSPPSPGRIEFVILRTGSSPPLAPHPASRRRS